jgi:hypothetical protein
LAAPKHQSASLEKILLQYCMLGTILSWQCLNWHCFIETIESKNHFLQRSINNIYLLKEIPMKNEVKESGLVLRKTNLRVMNDDEVTQVAGGRLPYTERTCESDCRCLTDLCGGGGCS